MHQQAGTDLTAIKERENDAVARDNTSPSAQRATRRFRANRDMVPIDLERLGAYLERVGLTLDRRIPAKQFASGLANINYLLSVDGRPVVLRRPPSGDLPPGAHDMAREHRILSRLSAAFPLAPKSLHLCEDVDILGVPFQLLEYRNGIVIKGDDASLLEDHPGRARALGTTLVGILTTIHSVDADTIGLSDLGRPEGFVARAIAGWRNRAERLTPSAPTAILTAEIGDWLNRQTLRERTPTLLHCDFKLDNVILDDASFEPHAVIDWDMGTRGDPLFDLATMLSYWTDRDDPPVMHRLAQMPSTAPGFPRRSEVVELYARARNEDISDFPAFRVLTMFKLGVVFLQLHALYTSGTNSDPRYARFGALGEELLLFTRDIQRGDAPLL